jgi:YidC/Oxa1 family membrane protein insertase
MTGWAMFVDLIRALLFATAHLCGNSLGSGILALSVLIRIALLPLTLRAARRMMEQQARLAALAPELERLKQRHGGDRARLTEATMGLYREHGISMIPSGTLGTALVQLPIGSAIYSALRLGVKARTSFLWMTDLTRPDVIVAICAALLAGAAAAVAPTSSTPTRSAIALSTLITLLFAWRLSASVGLYWLASNAVGVVQSLLLRRAPAPAVPARGTTR